MCVMLISGRPRFGSATVWGWNGSSCSGFRFRRYLCKKGFLCFRTVHRKGRFRFRFRFLEDSSGGSGSAFGFGAHNRHWSEGGKCRFSKCRFSTELPKPQNLFMMGAASRKNSKEPWACIFTLQLCGGGKIYSQVHPPPSRVKWCSEFKTLRWRIVRWGLLRWRLTMSELGSLQSRCAWPHIEPIEPGWQLAYDSARQCRPLCAVAQGGQ